MKIEDNAFYILDVSPNDNKRRILEQAEDKCLFEEQEKIDDAKNQLLDSKKRLAMELSWFPGASDAEVENIKSLLQHKDADSALEELNDYSRLNFELAAMAGRSYGNLKTKTALGAKICELAKLFEKHAIDFLEGFSDLLNDINKSRNISGFPEIKEDDLREALDNRRTQIINMLKDMLDQLPSDYLLETMKYIAVSGTGNTTYIAFIFIEEILTRYELEIQHFMETEYAQIDEAIGIAGKLAKQGKDQERLTEAISKICKYMQTWQQVVVPLQVVSLSKGYEHKQSADLLYAIRNLAVELNNAAGLPQLSKKLLVDLEKSKVYGYMPELYKLKIEDIKELDKLISSRKSKPVKSNSGNVLNASGGTGKIIYQDKWGLIFTHHITLTDQEIIYGTANRIKLDEIVGVSWGAISRSINFIPIGTEYTITFYTETKNMELSLNKRIFHDLIKNIWEPVCVRLMIDMLMELRKGKELQVGYIKFNDRGIHITKGNWFSAAEELFYKWTDVETYSRDGVFYVQTKDGKYRNGASYMDNRNTHILEAVIKQFFKNYNARKPWLSSLLN